MQPTIDCFHIVGLKGIFTSHLHVLGERKGYLEPKPPVVFVDYCVGTDIQISNPF